MSHDIQLEVSPNPFQQQTDIRYQMSDISCENIGSTVIEIYDATGRLVKSFHPAPDAARFAQRWYGYDEAGRAVPAGVYFILFENKESQAARKVTKLR